MKVEISEELAGKLDKFAKKEKRSTEAQITFILETWLTYQK